MNTTIATPAVTPITATPHRYQIYRQSRNGLHYNHGNIIDSPADAVAAFLHTAPAYEGGGLRLWDHYEQRHVASAEWQAESTHMGFTVRHRINCFHDPALAVLAAEISERERIEQSVTERIAMAM